MLVVRPTDELSGETLAEIRSLLDDAFGGEFDEHDWEHCLGGQHVLAYSGDRLVAHACVVERTLRCGDVPLRTGYVEAVAVRPGEQGHGHGRAVMAASATLIEDGYEMGALCTGKPAFYERLGWKLWRGPSYVDAADGLRATPEEDGAILVLPVAGPADLTEPIVCDWREGDVW
ncbi:GNAT family N-acetyltransferase [Allorhizocola rhizosphaerae]|uniref:GNAT family N-acetyltransferase n=1 Tax=Allorhizocola rhizosphaerae TaxID=1872709 RepID=UPI000E3EDB98|nr:GNAT family N-acetyltransferase [Allorhizocola rhizosphaerae]